MKYCAGALVTVLLLDLPAILAGEGKKAEEPIVRDHPVIAEANWFGAASSAGGILFLATSTPDRIELRSWKEGKFDPPKELFERPSKDDPPYREVGLSIGPDGILHLFAVQGPEEGGRRLFHVRVSPEGEPQGPITPMLGTEPAFACQGLPAVIHEGPGSLLTFLPASCDGPERARVAVGRIDGAGYEELRCLHEDGNTRLFYHPGGGTGRLRGLFRVDPPCVSGTDAEDALVLYRIVDTLHWSGTKTLKPVQASRYPFKFTQTPLVVPSKDGEVTVAVPYHPQGSAALARLWVGRGVPGKLMRGTVIEKFAGSYCTAGTPDGSAWLFRTGQKLQVWKIPAGKLPSKLEPQEIPWGIRPALEPEISGSLRAIPLGRETFFLVWTGGDIETGWKILGRFLDVNDFVSN